MKNLTVLLALTLGLVFSTIALGQSHHHRCDPAPVPVYPVPPTYPSPPIIVPAPTVPVVPYGCPPIYTPAPQLQFDPFTGRFFYSYPQPQTPGLGIQTPGFGLQLGRNPYTGRLDLGIRVAPKQQHQKPCPNQGSQNKQNKKHRK